MNTLQNWTQSNNMNANNEEMNLTELATSSEARAAALSSLLLEWRKANLESLDKLRDVYLVTEPKTPENHCLTASNTILTHYICICI